MYRVLPLFSAILSSLVASVFLMSSGCASHSHAVRPRLKVQIVSQPTGAKIEVNGQYVGDAPLTVDIEASNDGRFWRDTIIKAYPKDTGYTQIKASNPRVDKIRKTGIPPADASIFELKVGEVSQVFGDPGGFVIYKIEAVEDVPVAGVHDEISRALASGREKGAIESLQNSTKLDDAYFAPPAAATPPTLRSPSDAVASPTPSSPTSAPGKK